MAKLFISYSRVNLDIVQKIRQDLQNAGIDIWIDQVGLTPGTPDWDQALRDAIREASAVLLVSSPDSRRSPYVRDEVAIAKDAKKPIYPLWVAGESWIDCIPMGLGSTQNVDLRGDDYTENLLRLIVTLSGQTETEIEPITPVRLDDEPETPPPADPRNPYKGLRAFRSEDQQDFFGRDMLIGEFLNIVVDEKQPARLLAVLGASGSGKSSVMMAGVLPRLKRDHPDWIFLDPMVPGTNPLEKLTIMLARQFENKSQKTIREDLLDRSTRGLHGLVCELSDKPVVLYIDQFEEIFTLVDKEADRRHFIDILTTAATETDGVLYLLLSMRADFYDRPLQYNNFGKLIENHHVAVTPMTLADLYDVVQKPAQLPDVGLQFEDGLITEMVFAVREETAALPLLQFTLDQLFEVRDGHTLTLQAYRDLGGIQGALAGHADATFNSLSSDQHRNLARALFLRLIEPGQTEQDTTRRRANYSELTLPDVEQTRILQETADVFVNARLLVTDQTGDARTIEVSHEALIREWKRLGDWLHSAREDLRLQKSLSADVAEWGRRGKPTDMLYRGTILSDAQAWAERNPASRYETMFISASVTADKQQKAKDEAIARRVQNFQRIAVGLGGILSLMLAVLAVIALSQNAEAQAELEALNWQATLSGFENERLQIQMASSRELLIEPTRTSATVIAMMTNVPKLHNWIAVIQEFDDGVEMVQVPPGCFLMGSTEELDELPLHEQCFEESFWIDLTEVTQADFERLGGTKADDNAFDGDNRPVEQITWFEANEFCQLRNARLPTEAEWEYAARGPDSLSYPWGNEWNGNEGNVVWYENSEDQTAEVGSRPAGMSWVGAMDMSGNVWEWVNSGYEPYPYKTDDGRESDADNNVITVTVNNRVLRGGSWAVIDTFGLRTSGRGGVIPTNSNVSIGFRCARS